MPPFQEGHTTNVGKTYDFYKVKRAEKRLEKKLEAQALAMAEEDPNVILPIPEIPVKKKWDVSTVSPYYKGHPKLPGAGRKSMGASIKERILSELKVGTNNDAIAIARKLINMARSGDLRAIEMIMDRVDGKVPTTIGGDKDNPLTITIEPVLAAKYSSPTPPPPVLPSLNGPSERPPKKPRGRPRKDANTLPNNHMPGPAPIQSN